MQKRAGKICLLVTICLSGIVFTILFLTFIGVRKAEAVASTSEKVEILFAGERIDGLQGFTYEAHSIKPSSGQDKAGSADSVMEVKGTILVSPNSELLNKHMEEDTTFEIALYIMQGSYLEGIETHQFRLEGVSVKDRVFQMDAGGNALSTYAFTAAGVLSDQVQMVD